MLETLLLPDIKNAIEEGNVSELAPYFQGLHPTEAVEILAGLESNEILAILNTLEPQLVADIFCELPKHIQTEIAALMDRRALASLVGRLSPDDRVDFLKSMPENRVHEIMPALAQAERDEIKRLSAYPEGTAGSIMTTQYVTLPMDLTAAEAIHRLRLEAPRKESIYNSFIVDQSRKLLGSVSLRDLIVAEPEETLDSIMNSQVISVEANDDREDATFKISQYDLLAIPVVDASGAIVGIVTHDDAMDVIKEEQTEDMERFMGISGHHEDEAYLHTSTWHNFRSRVIWLIILAAAGLISGAVLQSFESTLTNLMILAFYMPMLADTGGNTGSQSATVVVRALALKEITYKDAFKVLFKELRIALMLGLVLGALAFIRVLFFTSTKQVPPGLSLPTIALAISIALSLQVLSATVIGAALPLLAARVGTDPALIASPALTTIVDITGLAIYFGTAKLLLRV
jgi:magnesium transporter